MKSEVVEKLAFIYVQTHTNEKTTPAQMYDLYQKAVNEIRTAEGNAHDGTL